MKTTTSLLLLGSSVAQAAYWTPAVGTTWQIVLSSPLSTPYPNVTAFDIDLFDNPKSTITNLKAANRKVICYFSAGSYEEWRSDASKFTEADKGDDLDDWEGERWINTNSANVRNIMKARLDLAVSKGCDAVDPDNIDAYANNGGGIGLTTTDAVNYVKFLATEAHSRNLAIGLKNGGAIASQVLSSVEFQVNEQCLQYDECNKYRQFITAKKPVFHIEYREGTPSSSEVNTICSKSSRASFSTLIKHLNLDSFYRACPA